MTDGPSITTDGSVTAIISEGSAERRARAVRVALMLTVNPIARGRAPMWSRWGMALKHLPRQRQSADVESMGSRDGGSCPSPLMAPARRRQSAYVESFGWEVERRVELPKYMFDEARDPVRVIHSVRVR